MAASLGVTAQQEAQSTSMSERFGSWITRLFVLVLFFVLAVGMTYPLILNMQQAVPGPPWDNCVWLYDLWWFRHSIVDLGEWPTVNPTIFYPFGYDLRLSETMLANKALIAPFLFWGDEILAYNAFLLISFILTGYTTYLLIAYLTDNPYAAVVGGAVFAFCPYRMHAMAAGWLPLLATHWIPLVFLYLERTLREGKARYALATGLFMALTILSSWYYIYIAGTLVFFYLLIRLRPWKLSLRDGRLVTNLILAGVVVLVMVGPLVLPIIKERSGQMGWSLAEVEKWAASVEDFFLPNVYHPLWGERFLDWRAHTLRYPWYAPGFVYLGIIALFLALKGVLGEQKAREITGAFFWVGALSFLLALGIVLHWRNDVVEVSVSPTVETFFARAMSTLMSKLALHKASYYDVTFRSGTIPIPLPSLLVYLFVPFGDAMRTLYRFGTMTILATSVLAGMGAARMLGGSRPPALASAPRGRYDFYAEPSARQRASWKTLVGTVFLLGLVLFDFCSAPLAYGLTEIEPQPLDRWLAARPDETVVMQFPLMRALSGDALYRTKYHGKKVAYGHGTFYPNRYRYAMPVLGSFPSDECLSLLQSWGVTHVLVGSGAYDAGWGDIADQTWDTVQEQIDASSRLQFVGVIYDEPFWRDERVSHIIRGSPPVVPVLVDKVYVYELQ